MAEQVALVTGANRGIGREVAAQLAGRGFIVIVSGRSNAGAVSAASEITTANPGADVRPLGVDLDVADEASVARLPDAMRRVAGRLDVLVNNAAAYVDWGEVGSTADLGLAHSVMETNLFGLAGHPDASAHSARERARPRRQRLQRCGLPRRRSLRALPTRRPGRELRREQGRARGADLDPRW